MLFKWNGEYNENLGYTNNITFGLYPTSVCEYNDIATCSSMTPAVIDECHLPLHDSSIYIGGGIKLYCQTVMLCGQQDIWNMQYDPQYQKLYFGIDANIPPTNYYATTSISDLPDDCVMKFIAHVNCTSFSLDILLYSGERYNYTQYSSISWNGTGNFANCFTHLTKHCLVPSTPSPSCYTYVLSYVISESSISFDDITIGETSLPVGQAYCYQTDEGKQDSNRIFWYNNNTEWSNSLLSHSVTSISNNYDYGCFTKGGRIDSSATFDYVTLPNCNGYLHYWLYLPYTTYVNNTGLLCKIIPQNKNPMYLYVSSIETTSISGTTYITKSNPYLVYSSEIDNIYKTSYLDTIVTGDTKYIEHNKWNLISIKPSLGNVFINNHIACYKKSSEEFTKDTTFKWILYPPFNEDIYLSRCEGTRFKHENYPECLLADNFSIPPTSILSQWDTVTGIIEFTQDTTNFCTVDSFTDTTLLLYSGDILEKDISNTYSGLYINLIYNANKYTGLLFEIPEYDWQLYNLNHTSIQFQTPSLTSIYTMDYSSLWTNIQFDIYNKEMYINHDKMSLNTLTYPTSDIATFRLSSQYPCDSTNLYKIGHISLWNTRPIVVRRNADAASNYNKQLTADMNELRPLNWFLFEGQNYGINSIVSAPDIYYVYWDGGSYFNYGKQLTGRENNDIFANALYYEFRDQYQREINQIHISFKVAEVLTFDDYGYNNYYLSSNIKFLETVGTNAIKVYVVQLGNQKYIYIEYISLGNQLHYKKILINEENKIDIIYNNQYLIILNNNDISAVVNIKPIVIEYIKYEWNYKLNVAIKDLQISFV